MSDPAPSLDGRQTRTLFRTMAACDLLTGVALVIVGFAADLMVLKLVGLALLLSGAGVAAYLSWRSNKPIQL